MTTTDRLRDLVNSYLSRGEKPPSYQTMANMLGCTKGVVAHQLDKMRHHREIGWWNKKRGHHVGKYHAKEQPAKRLCLRCQKSFPSWGKGNRMCSRCAQFATHTASPMGI